VVLYGQQRCKQKNKGSAPGLMSLAKHHRWLNANWRIMLMEKELLKQKPIVNAHNE